MEILICYKNGNSYKATITEDTIGNVIACLLDDNSVNVMEEHA